jgi:hypothetical protein
MTSITISDLLTIIFVVVDDWYQVEGILVLRCNPILLPLRWPNSHQTLLIFIKVKYNRILYD